MSDDSPDVLKRVHEGLPLVEGVARRLCAMMGPRANFDDFMSYGREGVFLAARRYDPDRPGAASFRTYAKNQIEYSILEGFRSLAPLSRRAHEKLTANDSAEPAQQEDIHRRLEQHVVGMAGAQADGLLAQLGLDTQGDFVAVSPKTLAEEASQKKEMRELVERCLGTLPADEARVIRLHYHEGVPIERIAKQLGIARVTTQSLHDRGLERMQKRLGKLK